ncbi:hypothetical protein CROQUDRAFT_35398 [Cronartium quercuum f. sp. fusiforme G11]|uniref:Phosphoglycerate mutase n=1 Tax=Cronartium quercuum f. sp. fusiforme G11 TaxID=708437 RepID=A0A9P6NZY1_9BASI|nr:hypothetical protein CROQUDRAFT_35398 [Cronartium quercuum f. sp. fusiforme G11]
MPPPKRLPKVYCVRHGPTEWSLNGRHTGTTDLPLTAGGELIISQSSPRLVGPGKILDPRLISSTFVSPRTRAQRTFELLFPSEDSRPRAEVVEDIREWTYGDYEGLWKHEVVKIRAEKGLKSGKGGWDIWVDGCEGGESPEEMVIRTDRVVERVKALHRAWMEDPSRKEDDVGGDVLIVAHGHFSRCFVARWLGLPLHMGGRFAVDTGSVTIGQYYHGLDATVLGGLNISGHNA